MTPPKCQWCPVPAAGRIAYGAGMAPVCVTCLAAVNAKQAWTRRALEPLQDDSPRDRQFCNTRAWNILTEPKNDAGR